MYCLVVGQRKNSKFQKLFHNLLKIYSSAWLCSSRSVQSLDLMQIPVVRTYGFYLVISHTNILAGSQIDRKAVTIPSALRLVRWQGALR
jgi:hypothetical protein